MSFHHSNLLYDQNQLNDSDNDNCKWNGSYSQIPSTEKTLSWKQNEMKIVYRSLFHGNHPSKTKNKPVLPHLTHSSSPLHSTTEEELTTMKILYLDELSRKNKSNPIIIKKLFRNHYRIDIKEYLKRKYNKPTFEIPIKAIEIVRTNLEKQKEEEGCQKLWKTQNLLIYKPFYNDNLRKFITENFRSKAHEEFFRKENTIKLIKQLLKCSIEFGGLDNFIMTTSNVYVTKDKNLEINYTSFAGLAFVKGKQAVLAEEFLEIAPYLTPNMIFKSEIQIQDKIRFFLINCLSLIRRKDFFYETESYFPNEEFEYEKAVAIVFDKDNDNLKLKKEFEDQFKKIFNNHSDKKRINKPIFRQIRKLMENVFVKGESFSWQTIVEIICIPENVENKFTQSEKEKFEAFHTQIYNRDPDKKFYEERGLHEFLLYIPIKFKANLEEVFKFGEWWELFNPKHISKSNSEEGNSNFGFCVRLLSEIVKEYQREKETEKKREKIKFDFVLITLLKYLCQNHRDHPIESQDEFKTLMDNISYFQE